MINKRNKTEWKIITKIKSKLREKESIITKADKGKTLIILMQEEYKEKTKAFIQENQFTIINNNPTQRYQKKIKQTLKKCGNIVQKENMEIQKHDLHGTKYTCNSKLHKPNMPIRTIINWKNAPTYKIAKKLIKTLHSDLNLPYTYNVCNSNHLMTELKTIELNSDARICSSD
jgi:hypothetical protein